MTDAAPGGPISDAELRSMFLLLARYASYELDQWDNWRFQSPHGTVYASISRAPLWGTEDSDDQYHEVWPLPAKLRPSRTKSEVFDRVEADLARGDRGMALHRLRSLAGTHPDKLEVRERLAEEYLREGNLTAAGRWRYFSPHRDERDEQARAAFLASAHDDPQQIMRKLRMNKPIDGIAEESVREQLASLRAALQASGRSWYDWDPRRRRWRMTPQPTASANDPWWARLLVTTGIIAVATTFVIGIVTVVGWLAGL